jgi:SAM-dependent methyltransferase
MTARATGEHARASTRLAAEDLAVLREVFARGENVMAAARRRDGRAWNSMAATLVAYDLQSGSYVDQAKANPVSHAAWCAQIAQLLEPWLTATSTVLEVGCGEATTLAGVLRSLRTRPKRALGFDISWSRCAVGTTWLAQNNQAATLFVADLFSIPLADNAVDVVYTSHSLEPNGGREREGLAELLRVARTAVVLVEPIFELATDDGKDRMLQHGYVRGLKETATALGAQVEDYRLLPYTPNPLNPSGVIVILKAASSLPAGDSPAQVVHRWQCPWTRAPLQVIGDALFCEAGGIAYPMLRGIPLLTADHAVIASRLGRIDIARQQVD